MIDEIFKPIIIDSLIKRLRKQIKLEGSTTNETGYLDGYYNIIINIPE